MKFLDAHRARPSAYALSPMRRVAVLAACLACLPSLTMAQAPLQKLQMKLRLLAITGDKLRASGPGEPANHGPICNL